MLIQFEVFLYFDMIFPFYTFELIYLHMYNVDGRDVLSYARFVFLNIVKSYFFYTLQTFFLRVAQVSVQ